MIQERQTASDRSEVKVDGEHGWRLADYVDRQPIDGEYVKVEQYFAHVDDGFSLEAVPEPAKIIAIASRPGQYWAAKQPAGSYDFRDGRRLSRGKRLVQTHSSEDNHVQFHSVDQDQSGVRGIFSMHLWGRIENGQLVPLR